MSDAVYPTLPGLAWNATWTPTFRTRIQTAVSGKEYRASMMANPIYHVTLQYEFLRQDARRELSRLAGFFLERRGAFDSFLIEHDTDNTVTDQPIGTADGLTRQFQLLRSFGSAFAEPVQNIKQISGIKVNGNAVAYTVSATGVVTLESASAAGVVTWSGSYYYRARFSKDSQEYKNFMNKLWSTGSIELIASLGNKV